jgi:DNA invertase Pin-like site-specific DNA recombinase
MPATIFAAQYLRMSTEHQRYSLTNQSATIAAYAAKGGLVVTRTYSDAGKSGLVLHRRNGLQTLLKDVVSGTAEYKAILVYDVSRCAKRRAWRFTTALNSLPMTIHYRTR